MFELNGTRYSNEDLQNAATKYNMDFDSYLDTMKQKGLKEIDIEDTARQTAFEAAPNINVKLGLLFDSGVKIMKDLITDPEEQKETAEVLSNVGPEMLRRGMNTFMYDIPNAIRQAYKSVRYDDLYDEEELKYLKTLDPNATYEEPSGDPTGFKTNADRIKYLEGYKSSSAGLAEQKANEKIVETIKKLEISDKYFRKDTGEGIVKGIKQGDASDLIGGIFNAGASTVETVVPAMLTYGTSIPFQITAPMITDYNRRKAENIYGKDDPDAIKKLFDNRQEELAVPATLGLVASSFEYVGFRGISNYILGKGAKNTAAKLLITGNKEGLTEIGQSGVEEVNIAKADGKDGLDLAKAFIDGVFSEKGIEAYLNGFIGGTTMSAGGSIVNRALRSDKASVKEFNNLVNDYAEFSFAKNKTTNKKDQKILGLQIKKIEQKIKDFVLNKRKIADILNEDQQSSLIDLMNQKDQNDSDIQNLQKRLQDNQITSKDAGYILRSLNNENKRIAEQVELINESAKEQLLQTGLEVAKEEGEKVGLKQELFETKEQYAALFGRKGSKKYKEALNVDGHISDDGKTYFVNMQTAREAGAIGVGSHELLHGIIGRSFSKLDSEAKKRLNENFLNLLSKRDKEAVLNRLENSYSITGDEVFTTEELYTAFSDEIIDGGVKFNEGVFGKIKNSFEEILRQLSSAGYFGEQSFLYRKEFSNARQAYNFVKDYSLTIKKTGKVTERAKEFAKVDPGAEGQRQSRSTPLEAINKLIPDNVKTQEDYYAILNDPRLAKQAGVERILDTKGNLAPVIEAYIKSRSTSSDMARENIKAVKDRLVNFDPNAKRADGSIVGPEGFGEFIFANANFGKMVAAKELAIKAEKEKKTTAIDTKEAREIEDTTPTETTQVDQKDVKLRKLNNFDIELEDGLVDAEIIAEVEALIEQNPSDLEVRMEKLILSDIRKKLDNAVGKIEKQINPKTGKKEGDPKPSVEYEKFIRNEFQEIVDGLGIATIRKAYKPFFKQEKTGRKDYKNIDPVTGVVSNYRKDTFSNKASKPDFIKYFLQGKPGVLRERRTALLRRIAKRKADTAIDKYIESNSGNIEAVLEAKLRQISDTAKNIQNEQVSFDAVKFSVTVKKQVNDYYGDNGVGIYFNKYGKFQSKGHALEQVIIDLLESYNLPTKYLKLGVKYATEKGGLADINLEVLGEALRIEVKLNESVPMGSVTASAYNLKTRVLELAKSSMDKSLPFDQIIELVHDDIVNLVEVYNGKVTAYNNKNGTNEPLMDTENPTGHAMVESIYNEMVAEGVTGKIFNKSFFPSPNAQPLIDHYLNKFAGAVKAIEIFGKGLYSFVPNSVLGPNVPYILNMARIETHVRVFNSGAKDTMADRTSNVKVMRKGKMQNDRYVRFTLQFQNKMLKNSLKTPKKAVSLTRKEDMLLNLVVPTKENLQGSLVLDKSNRFSRSAKNPSRGITVLDFDDTLATTESLVKYTKPDGETGTLNAEQYASTYESLLDQGYTFDFSDFNKVVKGKLAPLFNKAMKLQGKFGPENMFVLTARPPRAQKAIFDFLKANGLNIPLKNITGLGNSTSEAKALWIANKVGEGYNDFYFADDALQNVQAVKNMLDQFDVKSKVQQARVKFSQTLDKGFNDILQDVTGIKSEKRYSQAKARKRGEGKGKFRFFIPPSHEDFAGLLYNFMGSGRLGNKHRDFFEKALLKPLNRAYTELNEARQAIANDYKSLIRQFPEMRKKLTKKTPDGDYYYSDAVRVYLWNKAGFDIPGMSETDIKELTDLVTSDTELQAFAESIGIISKQEQGYVEPSEHWETGDIRTDLADATGRVGRKQFFGEFIENSDIIFSKENLNKIEAAYGRDFREALEDIIYRTKNGTNRTVGKNRTVNKFLDYLNGSIGATMFFNARSAVLQTISTVNFINFGDNNIFKAAKAFANQKQFWKDFSMIFNSDMLKQRRAGTAFDVNAAELSTAVAKSKEPVRAAIRHLLQIGFLPTQIADSFAISLGGSAMYRNRLNTYLKQGLSQKEAETKAFNDFQEVAESTQQSARPDKISQEQASPLGRMILAFQNTPSQYVRLIKKAGLDLINRRKTPPYKNQVNSDMSNVSKIIYYGAVQNVIFYGLQTALFAMMFDDDEQDEEFFSKKRDRIISGSIDTILRGMGVGGAIVSTIKNTAKKWAEQQGKGWGKEDNALMMEMLQLSPPIGIKARKLSSAEKTYDYNKKVIKEMETFDIDNPIWGAVGNAVEATTNIPLARLHRKVTNLRQAANSENEWWQRLAMALGWSQWDVGVKNEEVEKVKESIKKQKSNRKSKGFKNFKFK